MPRVSVIIPAYNHEKYVAEAIQSVLDQTYQDFEIVITDDGSADGTVREIKKFRDPRIRLFTFNNNMGAAVASGNCVRESKGEYIAMLSSDDVFMPDKLDKQVRFLDGHPDVWAVFSYVRIIDDKGNNLDLEGDVRTNFFDRPNRTRFEWLNHFFYEGNCLCHPSVLARREVYTELGPPDPRYAQLGDYYRWIKTCLKHEIYIIPERLVQFRMLPGGANASGRRPVVRTRSCLESSRIFRHYLEVDSAEDLLKIFPEAKKYGSVVKDLIPYFIARLALDNKNSSPQLRLFGINVLLDILADPLIAERLKDNYGFTYRDCIELTGRHDYLNTEARNELLSRNKELKAKNERIAALLNSNSWKVTAPLRWLSSLFKQKERGNE